ncbi:MAG: EFR1 family ferrodoxin [Cloacibacillus sp.]
MKIKNIVSLYFSPTSSTHRVLSEIAGRMPWPAQELDITDYSANDGEYRLSADELLLAGVPVYGGRVPAAAAHRIRNVRGSGGPAVIVAVFGNRDYDDALIELKDILEEQGFCVTAALAAVAEHNIMRSVARGRPDARDITAIDEFAARVVSKIEAASAGALMPVEVKGGRPYCQYNGAPLKPSADASCTKCGICADGCPVAAIPHDAPETTDEARCITCMRCIDQCPSHSRSLNKQMHAMAEKAFAMKNAERKEPEMFL